VRPNDLVRAVIEIAASVDMVMSAPQRRIPPRVDNVADQASRHTAVIVRLRGRDDPSRKMADPAADH
jgi:hypothetical protein